MPHYSNSNKRLNSIAWNEIFEYTKDSVTFIKWKHKRKARNNSLVNRANNGQAGRITEDNILSVAFEKNAYSIPKIIWVMHNGNLPEDCSVYFKDNNQLNCCIENLYVKETSITNTEKYSDKLKKYFKYDESSPSCLYWADKSSKSTKINIGDTAGSLDSEDGYWKIHGLGHHYKVHRVIWFLHNGKIPEGLHIDHINGVRSDNRISNLRTVIPSINNRNRVKNKNNLTGHNNISYYEGYNHRGTLIRKYVVTVSFYGKFKTRSFSCVKYGDDLALELALSEKEKLVNEVNSLGAGYTERHGT